ncbi:MAG: HesA/MoeB/ThiF family protein [Candidatus Eisenbacteria bacterium]
MSLSKDELERYARQLSMPGWGPEGQERVRSARVFLAGVGGLGCAAGVYLVTAGVGRVDVCDADAVERSNLNRQFLYTPRDVGQLKAELARERLAAVNPSVEVKAVPTEIDHATASSLIEGADVVVDCLDNIETRFALNRACIAARIPMVYAAVSEWTGYLSFLSPPDTPCLECFVTRTPPPVEPATPGPTPGALGALQAMEVLKHLTGTGNVMAGKLLILDGAGPRFDILDVDRDPACPACGSR